MENITLEVENFFQLRATVRPHAKAYAFYLYLNDTVVERTQYRVENSYKFGMAAPGSYRVKWYARSSSGEITTGMSQRFAFRGFRDVPGAPAPRDLAILGITRTSAFAAHVLAVKNVVSCFVDTGGEYVGGSFFGRPIVGVDDLPSDVALIGHEAYANEYPGVESFSLANGATDVLAKELHKFGSMELYRISRAAHLEGLTAGAYYIQNFIFNKYNCRVPFLARIGEGTRLGIGGIGTVIHPDSIVGRDCVIAQNVTLGSRGSTNGTPIVGNNVFIGPGAKCFGGRIGSNVVIGANAVVLDEIPDDCVVAGVPARIISRDIARYRGYTHRPPR